MRCIVAIACIGMVTTSTAATGDQGMDLRALMTAPRATDVPNFDLGLGRMQTDGGAAGGTTTLGFENRKRYVVPALLSAAIPGAGEIATGHWMRGLPLVLADVATWVGYAHFESEGRDLRTRYEAFADVHWRITGDANGNGVIDAGTETPGWQENLEQYYSASQPNPDLRWWDPNAPYECTCPFIPVEEDRQHYYENVGKYRYYWMGWDDWSYNPNDPRNSDSASHRAQYADMRISSNDNFDHATTMIVVAMANRLLSVAQSIYLVHRDGRGQEQFSVKPMKMQGLGAGLQVSLKY